MRNTLLIFVDNLFPPGYYYACGPMGTAVE